MQSEFAPEAKGAPPADAPSFQWFGALTRAMNVVGTILILAIAVAVNADVIGRDFFNQPIPGVVEFIGLSIVAIVFLQMANTLRENRHVTNDVIIDIIERSHPKFAIASRILFHLIGAVLMILIAWFVWPILTQNYNGGYFKGTSGLVEIKIWPFMVAIVFGAVVTAVQFLLIAASQATLLARLHRPPA